MPTLYPTPNNYEVEIDGLNDYLRQVIDFMLMWAYPDDGDNKLDALSLADFTDVNGTHITYDNNIPGDEYDIDFLSYYRDGVIAYEDSNPEGFISGAPLDQDTDWIYLYGAIDFLDHSNWEYWDGGMANGTTTTINQFLGYLAEGIRLSTGWSHKQLLGLADPPSYGEYAGTMGVEPENILPNASSVQPDGSCEEPLVTETMPECPPPCADKPDAISPNWTTLNESQPFLEAKTCEYSIALNTEYEGSPAEVMADESVRDKGIIKLLEYYGKQTETYTDEDTGTEVDPLSFCVDNGAKTKDTFVSTRPLVKTKALVVIPYDTLHKIDDLSQPEEQPKRADQPAFVVLKGADFKRMCRQSARAMEIMAVRQAVWFFNEGGQLSEPTFDLKAEADRIRVFRSDMMNLLRENDFKIKRPAIYGRKWVDTIEIGFSEQMGVEYVKVTERGCDKPEMLLKAMSAFKGVEPQTLARTMYFVSMLPDIWNDATCSDSIDFGDFLAKYVAFPPIEVVTEPEGLFAESSLFCSDLFAEDEDASNFNLGDEFQQLGKSIMDEVLSLPNAFAERFANDLCATLEGKTKNDVDMNDLGELATRAADTALRDFFAGDQNLERIPELLAQIGGDPNDLWTKVLDNLTLCGLLALLDMAFACLFAGLSMEDAMSEMIKAAFKAMDDANFEKIFIGLPPDVQRDILAEVGGDLASIPPPWDSDYREGSYSGQGFPVSLDQTQMPTGTQGTESTETVQVTLEDGSTVEGERTTTDADYPPWQYAEEVVVAGVPTMVGTTTGVVISETAIGASYGSPGSVGTALGNIQGTITSAYKDAIIDMIDREIIDLEMLQEQLSRLPGAQIISTILQEMDCPPFPLFTPPLFNVLDTLELGFCPNHFAITLPIMNLDIFFGDIFKLVISVAKELIKELVVQLIILILTKLLQILFDALCALLGLIGDALINAITGGNEFRAALGDALCDEATDEDIDEALRTMMEATGIGSCDSPDAVPTREDAAAFGEVVASVLNNSEVLNLLNGEATPQVQQMLSDAVGSQVPSLECMKPADIGNLFSAFGKIVNPKLIEDALNLDADAPVCNSICATTEQLEMFNEIRCQALQEKGLSPEECEEQLESLRNRAKEDLADLANILQGGPFQSFPDIMGSDPICPDTGEPMGTGNYILPEIPQALNDAASNVAKKTFEYIGEKHVKDLVGVRGFLDMVLSDSNGAGMKYHNFLVNSFLGQPLSEDLSFFQFYTDNWMDEDGGNTALKGAGFNDLGERGKIGDWGFAGFNKVGTGGYPLTVASLLQKYFLQYNQTLSLGTETKDAISPGAMRGDALVNFDPNVLADGSTRAAGWNTVTPALSPPTPAMILNNIPQLSEYKEVMLDYEDYSTEAEEKYTMQLAGKCALKEFLSPDGAWNSVDRTQTTITETFGEGDDGPQVTNDFIVTHSHSEEVNSLLSSLELSVPLQDRPLGEAALGQYISDILTTYSDASTGDIGSAVEAIQDALPVIQDVYMRKFALLLASDSSGDATIPPDPYQFGYAISQQPVEVIMAGNDVDQDFAEANDRGTAPTTFDDMIYARFGGNPDNPPFYIREPERYGWLGMADKLVPEWDACDPVDGSAPREPICKFEDLKDMYTDLMNKYQDDKRLFLNPESSCVQPIPFNQIMSRGAAAGVDSAIIAVIRIYVIESLLRGTAIFSVFSSDCFNEILSRYMTKFIEEDIQQMGVWGLPSKKYFYLFMEQIVQMFGRQVDLGMITPTTEQQTAMDNLNALQSTFQHPSPQKISLPIWSIILNNTKYNNLRDEMVQEALDKEASGEWTAGIRTLLSHFMSEEIENMQSQFEELLYAGVAPIPNIQSIFMGSAAFIQGGIDGNILDVWNGLESSDSNISELSLNNPPVLGGGFAETDIGIGNHPFRLERYVRLTGEGTSRVIVLGDFTNEVLDDLGGGTLDDTNSASSFYSDISVGYRIVFTTSASHIGNDDWGGKDVPDELEAVMVGTNEDTKQRHRSFMVPVNSTLYSSDVYTWDRNYLYMVPLVSSEKSMDMTKTLALLKDEIEDFDSQERACILGNMAADPAYQMIFGISVPFEKMLSWFAIYVINNFLPSVGWTEDGWVKNGGKWMGFSGGFRSWDQRSFEKSKRAAKSTFMRFYHSSDPTYEDEEQKAEKKRITKAEKVKSNADPGWRWWRLRRKIRKPTDKNDVLCP